jgi:hypothetical protein
MADTSYSIKLEGIDLPSDVKKRIDAALERTVMHELGMVDLKAKLGVSALELQNVGSNTERLALPGGLMGFVVRTITGQGSPNTAERSVTSGGTLFGASSIFGSQSALPFMDSAAMEAICQRPDVRQAIIASSQALMDLLSRDEQATKNFNDLITNLNGSQAAGERNPLVAGALAIAAGMTIGAVVGYFSRPK